MNVVLVLRTGGDFNYMDVDLLANHLKKQWQGKSKLHIYCLFDGIATPYDMVDFTFIPMENKWPGWWSKINLFSPSVSNLRPFCFFDLDTAIIRYWDEQIVPINLANSFITLEDFYHKNKAASGMMWIPDNDKVDILFNSFVSNPKKYMEEFRGDQNYIDFLLKPDNFFQSFTDKITTFKPFRKGWLEKVPEQVSFVCFHGQPRIWKAAKKVDWVQNYIHKQTYAEE